MRRLGAVAVALACAAAAWGAAAAAEPTPGPRVTLTKVGYWGDGAPDDQMAVDVGGTAYATSTYGASSYRIRPAGGAWSAPRTLPRQLSNTGIHVAASKIGTAVAAYVGPGHPGDRYLAAQARRTSGTWTAPFRLATRTTNTWFDVKTLSNVDGDHAVVWSEQPVSGATRRQVKVGIFLRGDRWRVYAVGPGDDFQAGMDGSGAVHVTRVYTPSGGLPTLVQRSKRPAKAMTPAVSFGVVPEFGWRHLVETTGRQTVVLNDDTDARVLRQESLGGPFVQVWRKDGVAVEAAVGGARLRVVWRDQDPGQAPVPSPTWTQVVRPHAQAAEALSPTTYVQVGMDKLGIGVIAWREGDGVAGRTFDAGGLSNPTTIVSGAGSVRWVGRSGNGHLLQLQDCTNCGLLPEEGGGPPYDFDLYAAELSQY